MAGRTKCEKEAPPRVQSVPVTTEAGTVKQADLKTPHTTSYTEGLSVPQQWSRVGRGVSNCQK